MTVNITIDLHKVFIAIIIGVVFVCFITKIDKIVDIIEEHKTNNIIVLEEQKRETMRHKYSFEKAQIELEHKNSVEMAGILQNFENTNRVSNYEDNYQLKKIELKGTVLEVCANNYEKSSDFINCVRTILKNEIIKE